MSEAQARATDSSRTVILTAASIIAAIMIERLVGRLGELSDGPVLWGSSGTVLAQSALILVAIGNWWVFYATVTSIGRWVLTPLDLLSPLAVGGLALLAIENISLQGQTEFLGVMTIVWLGGIVVDRIVVAGMRSHDNDSKALFDHYPDRWVERLFAAAAAATGSAWLLRLLAEPSAFLTNALILVAAVLDAGIVFLQLRWWNRAMRSD
jgi:hypothetical protein